jgi:hypothetical protein
MARGQKIPGYHAHHHVESGLMEGPELTIIIVDKHD